MQEPSKRRLTFDHDGHSFVAEEQRRAGPSADAEEEIRWCVTMDGREVLAFHGPYPYRDAEVTRRVVEWYEIQKPRR